MKTNRVSLAKPISFIVVAVLLAGSAHAAELRFAGVLENLGEGGVSLITFAGQPAAGMGPVIDDEATIWERGGSKQLNRYALDGRLLASYPLPESTDRNDPLTRAGNVLVMKIRKALYSLPLDAAAGLQPERLAGEAVPVFAEGHLVSLPARTGCDCRP